MRVDRLRWDEENIVHIAIHHVEQDEVEAVAFGSYFARRGREENRYEIYGQTEEGRYLFVIIDHEGKGVFYVVTARDMDGSERRFYQRRMRK